jgi:hypothetical protein
MSSKNDDCDPIFIIDTKAQKENETGDLYQLSNKFYELLNLKIAFILFLLYYILNTDIFIELAFSNGFIKNTYDSVNDKITERGVIISGIVLTLCYLIIDILDKKNII